MSASDPLVCLITGAHGFEESLSKNMGNDTLPRPMGLHVINLDSLHAENSSTKCEKQQYLQGSLYHYNLTKCKYNITQYQFAEIIKQKHTIYS